MAKALSFACLSKSHDRSVIAFGINAQNITRHNVRSADPLLNQGRPLHKHAQQARLRCGCLHPAL